MFVGFWYSDIFAPLHFNETNVTVGLFCLRVDRYINSADMPMPIHVPIIVLYSSADADSFAMGIGRCR